MMGDGQVSMGNMVVKPNARKIRRILPKSVGGKDEKDEDKKRLERLTEEALQAKTPEKRERLSAEKKE